MIELKKMVFAKGFSPYRHLTPEKLEEYTRQCKGGEPYHVAHDGFLTTIREYAPAVARDAEAEGFPASWLDEPCIAYPLEDGVICSGRAIIGFYDPRPVPTRRPAYIVVSDKPYNGQIAGMRLVQSA